MKKLPLLLLAIAAPLLGWGQDEKIIHADPVFEDLVTALGAGKGEMELNLNFGYRRLKSLHHTLLGQLEFEFTPADKLGFELLLPYTLYFTNPLAEDNRPDNKIEYFQWTMQYTAFQSFERKISLAFGLTNSFQSQDPYVSPEDRKDRFSIENIIYQPHFIAAKNWRDTYFVLLKGGAELDQDRNNKSLSLAPLLTSAFHLKWSEEKDNFVGVEINKIVEEGELEMFFRPQFKFELGDKSNLGAAVGIPVVSDDTRWSGFVRLAFDL